MPLKIVRNDITRMNVDAVINTAASTVNVGPGCDSAIYTAAGFDELLAVRAKIGDVPEGGAFITPGFNLPACYIIHAVSPLFIDGESGEEEKLRNCYRNSLNIALEHGLNSVAFPLISTGSFGYPREEGMRIAVDEVNAFLLSHNMLVYIVVFDAESTALGDRITGGLEQYIDDKYVDLSKLRDMPSPRPAPRDAVPPTTCGESAVQPGALNAMKSQPFNNAPMPCMPAREESERKPSKKQKSRGLFGSFSSKPKAVEIEASYESEDAPYMEAYPAPMSPFMGDPMRRDTLDERLSHRSDTFSEYLMYLIERKGMSNSDVYKRAVVDKKVFSKIKNNPTYHPNKITALCLCVGAQLCLDDTKDLLARAGYALSPCDKTDIIFSYFIEREIFDIIEIDIALEEHGEPCLIA